jgi:subtilase family serine protease
LHLYLLLARTTAQQADLDNLIMRQQQPTAPEYHKWLTPKEFGARFGASPGDIATLSTWLESHGFQIRSVLNNASMIDFAATAGQVREAFHTELHYFNIRGGKYAANVQDPQIPAALSPVVTGIKGLNKIPSPTNHTKVHQTSYDEQAHRWSPVELAGSRGASPDFNAGSPYYLVTPQDFYTIYDVNPVFTSGNLAATANVAVIEESDIEYGTVGAGGVATGGDVATFRTLFGVPGTLNMHVYHGYGTTTCNDPGIDPDGIGEDQEASLDAEWINATAPSANLIFMSCDQSPDNGIFSSLAALADNNISDVMSLSYGESELN